MHRVYTEAVQHKHCEGPPSRGWHLSLLSRDSKRTVVWEVERAWQELRPRTSTNGVGKPSAKLSTRVPRAAH
jgi:hypothetical protein